MTPAQIEAQLGDAEEYLRTEIQFANKYKKPLHAARLNQWADAVASARILLTPKGLTEEEREIMDEELRIVRPDIPQTNAGVLARALSRLTTPEGAASPSKESQNGNV